MIGALLLSAFAMGLLGSTHCVVMCGGVVGVLSGGLVTLESGARASRLRRVKLVLAYNAGRIASYAVAGGIAGAFGALIDRVPMLHGAALALRLVAGALMLGLGLYLAGAWQRFALLERLGVGLWRRIEPAARRLLPVRSVASALGLGALWGWMPCGLVYAALAMALGAGAPASGALAMIAFGAGTLPTLVTMGAAAARVAEAARRPWVRRVAGAAIVAFGTMHVAAASAQIADHGHMTHACCAGHGGHDRARP
jgi:sulfite exporter TauE/SafE